MITTEDGSSSLLHVGLGETYHSRHGALQESLHVFIASGLHRIPANLIEVSILEIGFGTGLNAWLTWLDKQSAGKKITYTSLETMPLSLDLAGQLSYAQSASRPETDAFRALHACAWNTPLALDNRFVLHKVHTALQQYATDTKFNLIYFDAFGPPVQPEMWTIDLFRKIFEMSNPGAVFVTYCAKGQVRRDLQGAGWKVERLPGPPGKREMLRAIKPQS